MIDKYDDIINMDHPVSKVHKQMSMHDRAAQFSPFAALTGYDDVIEFQNRIQDIYNEVSDDKAASINETINRLKYKDTVSVEYYDTDRYRKLEGKIRKISISSRQIIVEDILIDFDNIRDLSIID